MRKYRAKYSESEEFIVYHKFRYNSVQRGIKGFLATTFAAISIGLLTPLPDEIFVIPAIAKFFQGVMPHLELNTATLYAYGAYKGIGLLFLILTMIFGVQYLRDAFAKKKRHIKKLHHGLKTRTRNVHEKTKATVKKHLSVFF
jgi:type II secretory pathway component PulF